MFRPKRLRIDTVLELVADTSGDFSELDVVVYGSTVRQSELVGDLDLWLDGAPEQVGAAAVAFQCLGRELGVKADVVRGDLEQSPLLDATRWCVHHDGIQIAGVRPTAPAEMTEKDAEAIYRSAVDDQARAFAHRADVLARAELPSASVFIEAALNALTRSTCTDRHEERLVRRLPPRQRLDRLQRIDARLHELAIAPVPQPQQLARRLADVLL